MLASASLAVAGLCLLDSAIAYHFNQELPKIEAIRLDAQLYALEADPEGHFSVNITEKGAFEHVVGVTDDLIDRMESYTSSFPVVRLFSPSIWYCYPRDYMHVVFFRVSFYGDADFYGSFNEMKCYFTYRGSQGILDGKTKDQCANYCNSLASEGFAFYYNADGSTNGALCATPAPSGTCYYRYNGQPAGSLPGVNRDACASYCASYAPYGYSFYFNNDSVCAPAAPPAPPTPAPVNCQVSGWTDASGCSATVCGTQGTKQQTRTVTQQPMYGGAACPPLTQSVSCNAPPCPAPAPAQCYYRYNGGSPNQLPNLTKEQCAAYCTQYAPYGYSFYHNSDGSTNGAVCAPPAPTPAPPTPVNCQVSGWTDSSSCSATVCGTQGTKQQTRTVMQAPMYGGTACPPLSQSITCSAPACAPINCQVSGWTDASGCSATVCGTQGSKQQTRTVTQAPMYGGTACPPLSQSVSCSAPACAPTPTPVNCQVSGWTDSSGCSAVNCGTQGTKQQIRTVTQQPMYGGTACPPLSQSVSCSAPACPAPAPSAPISGANEWDQLLWPPGTPLCWKRKSSDNDLFSISQLTESECKTYCGSDTNCYFNATGDKTNHLNPKPDQANSKCMTGNWDAGVEVKVDGTKQTKADCARLCSTNGPYVYWEPETQNPQNSICEPNDKKKCWRPTLGVGKMLVPFQTGTTNLHSTQYERCAETCAYLDDQGRTSDNSMNNQYQRATTARFWSPRGITNANGQREKELCMDKNVKRCWYMNTSGQLDYPSTWTKRRLASDGTLADQQLCDDTACNNSRLYKDVKWGTSRETGIDFCSNPNRRTTLL